MRFPVFPALLLMLLCMAIDSVIYKEIIFRKGRGIVSDVYRALAVILSIFFLVIVFIPKRSCGDDTLRFVMWGLFIYLSIYIPKLIFLLFQALSYVPLVFRRKRVRIMDKAGAIAATGVFIIMWWGAIVTRTEFETKKVDIEIAALPETFDGFTIMQFSDFHLGTFGQDTAFVHKIVEEINHCQPDMIVFTGDIVNRRSTEVTPFIDPLSRLRAKYGVYAVLGNHDYGDYFDWTDENERAQDVNRLTDYLTEMGWKILDNESEWIHIGGDSIAVVGVGNISRLPFRIYGDLTKAYHDLADDNIKILLSHNPDHWTDDIMNKTDVNIQLTLSGHTHAMQIEVGGMSPASLKYDNWGNLSEDSLGHKLFVNKGLGTEGIPSRIGAVPELSLFTLKAEKK